MSEGKAGHTALRTMVRIAIVAAGLASLGACASIPQRAWANGQGMTSSHAYRSVMSGNMSMQAHRELMWSSNPLAALNYSQAYYKPFGDWWY
jgi:hypothetical protein